MKINVGCGTDIREGFINIDGSDCVGADEIMDISADSLLERFDENSCEYILANDIVEHYYHWEAVEIISAFYKLCRPNGVLEIRVPDAGFIVQNNSISIDDKLLLLFGGQDKGRNGGWNKEQDESRKRHPELFCHKYGWTKDEMSCTLRTIGFCINEILQQGTNMVVKARKEGK